MARVSLDQTLTDVATRKAEPKTQLGTTTAAPVTQPKPAEPAGAATYLEFIRKEARFTQEQLDDLTSLSRRLNRAKAGGGPRITENTLIRVAVDLLLAHRDELHGDTEQELRNSVKL